MFCSILINVMDNGGDVTVIKFLVGSNVSGENVISCMVGICVGCCNMDDGVIVDGADDDGARDFVGMNCDVFDNDGDCVGPIVRLPLSWDAM
jgi:hypothetical protein